jgi:cbb3-type cytochrome oxidase subunit 3
MKLSDIMGNAGLSMYAQVALVLFLGVFIAITIRTFAPSRRRELDEAARIPLDDGPSDVRKTDTSRAQEN